MSVSFVPGTVGESTLTRSVTGLTVKVQIHQTDIKSNQHTASPMPIQHAELAEKNLTRADSVGHITKTRAMALTDSPTLTDG